MIAEGPEAAALYAQAMTLWRCLTAAIEVGIGAASLDLGVEYVKTRFQFGVPIGSFQAIQHGLADVAVSVDGARLLAFEAAAAIDADDPARHGLALMAYLFGADTAHRAAGASLHYHGGYGYMEEYDMQLYFRRSKALQLLAGDPQDALDDLAGPCSTPRGRGWTSISAPRPRRSGRRSPPSSTSIDRARWPTGCTAAAPSTTGTCTGRWPQKAG